MKRTISLIVCLCLLLSLAACGQPEENAAVTQPMTSTPTEAADTTADAPLPQEEAKEPQGRLVEETLDFGENLSVRAIQVWEEQLYAVCLDDDRQAGLYLYNEEAPEKVDIPPLPEDYEVLSFQYAPEGRTFFACMDYKVAAESAAAAEEAADGQSAANIVVEGDGGAMYSMELPPLLLLTPEGEGYREVVVEMPEGASPTAVYPLEDDSFLVCTLTSLFKVDAEGKKLLEYPLKGNNFMAAFGGGKLFAFPMLNEQGSTNETITVFDAKTGLEETSFVIPDISNMAVYSGAFSADSAGNLYFFNASGIFRRASGGDKWEQLVDGLSTMLGDPSMYTSAARMTPGGDGYLQGALLDMGSMRSESLLLHYYWSEEAPIEHQTEIDILAVADFDGVRSAISEYQRAHPEVKINYRAYVDGYSFMMMGYDLDTTQETQTKVNDAVRAVNTEVLSGNVPDILIMDLLPLESYIEKGFVKDLSSYASSHLDAGEWVEGIVTAFEKEDGTLPCLVTSFSVPVYWGSAEDTDLLTDLKALADFAAALPEDHVLTTTIGYTMMLSQLYPTNYMEWLDAEGKIDFGSDAFREFAEALRTIQSALPGEQTLEEANADALKKLISGEVRLYQDYLSGSSSQMAATALLEARGKPVGITTLPNQSGKKVYLPQQIVAVDVGTEHEEIVLDFLDTLMSESAQKAESSYSGYPVNAEVLEGMLSPPEMDENALNDATAVMSVDGYTIEIGPIGEKESKMLKELVYGLDTPANVDYTLLALVIEEMKPYLMGNTSLDAMIASLTSRARTYLAE